MSTKTFLIGAVVSIAVASGVIGFCRTLVSPQETTKLPPTCSVGPSHPQLITAHSPTLKKLVEYEILCKGAATDQLMTFAAMPTTNAEATQSGTVMATMLREFSDFSITPLVIFEPSLSEPTIISDIKNGTYDTVLKTYFETIQHAGISDAQMGTWVLFPEANTPAWHNTNPDDFAANVTKVASFQKAAFPASKVSILLNSWSYPGDDTSWNRGELKSLLPYVERLPAGIVNSLGLQGFPFKSSQGTPDNARLLAKDFLPATLAKEAASRLQVKEIWLNTGTFGRMYADTPTEVTLSAEERKVTLESILHEATQVQHDLFTVSVNIFAQNKASSAEKVDWSYWPTTTPAIGANAQVLETFLRQLHNQRIHISLYDSTS